MKSLNFGDTEEIRALLARCARIKNSYIEEHAANLSEHLSDFERYKRNPEVEHAWHMVSEEYANLLMYMASEFPYDSTDLSS